MNNEPVAWYSEKNDGEMVFATSKAERGHLENKGLEVIPLYTHPAKTLTELSGVEIIGMSGKYDFNYEVDIIDFVRACLRKAQEK